MRGIGKGAAHVRGMLATLPHRGYRDGGIRERSDASAGDFGLPTGAGTAAAGPADAIYGSADTAKARRIAATAG
jgi:hypothetical protein